MAATPDPILAVVSTERESDGNDRVPRGKGEGSLRRRRTIRNSLRILGGDDPAVRRRLRDETVGYIEGWYVDADVRRRGIGKRLVLAAEDWAREEGCSEMGSDCLFENRVSLRAHRAIGYEERERLVHFRRWLTPRR